MSDEESDTVETPAGSLSIDTVEQLAPGESVFGYYPVAGMAVAIAGIAVVISLVALAVTLRERRVRLHRR